MLSFGIPKFPIPSLSTSENPGTKDDYNLVMINYGSTNESINVESVKAFKTSLLRQAATLDAKPKSTAVFSPDRKRPQRCYRTLANFKRAPMSQIATLPPIPIQPQNRNIKGEKDHVERKLNLVHGSFFRVCSKKNKSLECKQNPGSSLSPPPRSYDAGASTTQVDQPLYLLLSPY